MSALLGPILSIVRWIGRTGTRGVAVAMISATLLPGLGDTFRPALGVVVFALLSVAFVRLQPAAMAQRLRRPGVPIAVCIRTALCIPLLSGLLCHWLNIHQLSPDLYTALMLQAIASPMMATPAITMLLGLDATVVLIVMVTSTALLPISAALFANLLLGAAAGDAGLSLPPGVLGLRLFVLLAGSAMVGFFVRRALGVQRVATLKLEFNGLNIVMLFMFAAAIMGNVIPNLIDQPMTVLRLTAAVFVVFFALQGLSTLLFWRTGRDIAISVGFMCSQRNMEMMLVATAGSVSEQVWLYCAIAQLPIYLGPMLMTPIVRRCIRDHG